MNVSVTRTNPGILPAEINFTEDIDTRELRVFIDSSGSAQFRMHRHNFLNFSNEELKQLASFLNRTVLNEIDVAKDINIARQLRNMERMPKLHYTTARMKSVTVPHIEFKEPEARLELSVQVFDSGNVSVNIFENMEWGEFILDRSQAEKMIEFLVEHLGGMNLELL